MTLNWPDSLNTAAEISAVLDAHAPSPDSVPPAWYCQWQNIWLPLAAWLAERVQTSNRALIVGVHGGQGSGKSTLSIALRDLYQRAFGWNTVVVSLDDLYLSHSTRQTLSQTVHPLLATRGVPGTHDAAAGIALFDQLRSLQAGETLCFPAFDKASDDRLPETQWHQVKGPVDLIIFEGWCVGCEAVSEQELQTPVNTLEAEEDADGHWRRYVNEQLQHTYHDWFAMIDELIMLSVPDMEAVLRWRSQQESGNRANAAGGTDRSMDTAALVRFIQHYERLTRQALKYLPRQATLILEINQAHQVASIATGGQQS